MRVFSWLFGARSPQSQKPLSPPPPMTLIDGTQVDRKDVYKVYKALNWMNSDFNVLGRIALSDWFNIASGKSSVPGGVPHAKVLLFFNVIDAIPKNETIKLIQEVNQVAGDTQTIDLNSYTWQIPEPIKKILNLAVIGNPNSSNFDLRDPVET